MHNLVAMAIWRKGCVNLCIDYYYYCYY